MDTMPWSYYHHHSIDGRDPIPNNSTIDAINAVKRALDIQPDHPLSLHLLLHLMEPSGRPRDAEAVADALRIATPKGIGEEEESSS